MSLLLILFFFFFSPNVHSSVILDFPDGSVVKKPSAVQETQIWSLGQEVPLEEGMATHSSILALTLPWTEEPGRLPFIRLSRVGHN